MAIHISRQEIITLGAAAAAWPSRGGQYGAVTAARRGRGLGRTISISLLLIQSTVSESTAVDDE
jgi:hypothetical protein